MSRYSCVVRWVCIAAQALAALLVLVDLVLIGLAVLMRYVLSSPISWGDEIVALSLTAIVMLAAPEVLRRNGHIAVDVVTANLPRRFTPWVNVWSCVAVLSMAGIGFDRTRIRVVADPALRFNTHTIDVKGRTGRFSIRLENVPAPELTLPRLRLCSALRPPRGPAAVRVQALLRAATVPRRSRGQPSDMWRAGPI